MTDAERDRPRIPRRTQAIAGAVGLAAVLGGGAFLVTDRMSDDTTTVPTDIAAPAVPVPSASMPSASAPASAATSPAASSAAPKPAASAAPAPATSKAKTRAQMIEEAKGTAAKADNVRRPLAPQGAIAAVADADVTVTQTGSLTEGGTLKVVSAKSDLTGQRELGIVADDGRAVGEARCTQNVRFSAEAPAVEKPTMLICWRTSAGRSVYTVSVVRTGRPSAETAVAALNKRWAKLG